MKEVHEQTLKVLTSFYGTPTADQRDHIASMAGAVMSEAVAPEMERLKSELTRHQDVNRIVVGERDAWKTRTAEARSERDALRAAIERVRAMRRSPGIKSVSSFVSGQDDGWDQALAAVDAALTGESCPLCGGAGVVPGTEEPETNTTGEPCDCVLRGER